MTRARAWWFVKMAVACLPLVVAALVWLAMVAHFIYLLCTR